MILPKKMIDSQIIKDFEETTRYSFCNILYQTLRDTSKTLANENNKEIAETLRKLIEVWENINAELTNRG